MRALTRLAATLAVAVTPLVAAAAPHPNPPPAPFPIDPFYGGVFKETTYYGCYAQSACFSLYFYDQLQRYTPNPNLYDARTINLLLTVNTVQPMMVELIPGEPAFACCDMFRVGLFYDYYATQTNYGQYAPALASLKNPPSTWDIRIFTPDPTQTPPIGADDLTPYSIAHDVTLTATPEPTSLVLVAGGLVALVGAAVRRKRAA